MEEICPFCKCDPYEYVDVGVGMVPVAVNCCDAGIELHRPGPSQFKRALSLMCSDDPRRARHGRRLIRTLHDRTGFNGD